MHLLRTKLLSLIIDDYFLHVVTGARYLSESGIVIEVNSKDS